MKKAFLNHAASAVAFAIAVHGHGLAMAEEPSPQNGLVVTVKTCLDRSRIQNPASPVQGYLSRLYQDIGAAGIGQDLLRNPVDICLDPALQSAGLCGRTIVGTHYQKVASINPSPDLEDEERALTLVHELRHEKQDELGLKQYAPGNVPENERVILYWIKEADSRLASVMFAYERNRQGESAYLDYLRDDGEDGLMVIALERELQRDPANMPGAMRAAFRALFESPELTRSYANEVAEWAEESAQAFRPDQDAVTLLDENRLMTLGQMGSFGNYMNPALIQAMRDSFSAKDYSDLTEIRKTSGGTTDEACKPPPAAQAPQIPAPAPAGLSLSKKSGLGMIRAYFPV